MPEPLPHVRWHRPPEVQRPVLVLAWEGWNDAGDAASAAAAYAAAAWHTEVVAEIDPEEFFDFSSTRPEVYFDEAGLRQVRWPCTTLATAHVRPGLDVAVLRGDEPQLRWRTYCDQVIGIAHELGARLVVTLGALLAEVPHTRPTPVFGTAYDPAVEAALDLRPSSYEGPTGIVGVLHTRCRDAGLDSAALWAAVPSYVPGAPSPKAALALVQRLGTLLDVEFDVSELETEAVAYERQVSSLVEDDDDTAGYVARLEQRHDHPDDSDTGRLIAELERFLRDQS